MDLSGHQSGILKLTCWTAFAPFKRVFGMKIVNSKGEKQKNKQEGDIVWFFAQLGHRIPRGNNIREIGEKCQMLLMIPFLGMQNLDAIETNGLKLDFESTVCREPRRPIAFYQFVLLVEDIV